MSDTSRPENQMTDREPEGGGMKSGLWVVGIVMVFATGLAIFASYRFRSSEQYLTQAHDEFAERGEALTVSECVNSVLEWRHECEAMKSLCDSNVERMVTACIEARDRSGYCASVGDSISDSHFSAAACADHGIDRSEREPWKFCGMAYRAVDFHCRSVHQPSESSSGTDAR